MSALYIYIIYTLNLRSRIAVFAREREHGRFEESTKRVLKEQQGSNKEHGGARRNILIIIPSTK